GAALQQRIEAALSHLQAIAPWLRDPCEAQLRTCSMNDSFGEVMQALCRVPLLSELPSHYDAVEACVLRRLQSSEPLLGCKRETLERLLDDIRIVKPSAVHFKRRIEEMASVAANMASEMDFAFL